MFAGGIFEVLVTDGGIGAEGLLTLANVEIGVVVNWGEGAFAALAGSASSLSAIPSALVELPTRTLTTKYREEWRKDSTFAGNYKLQGELGPAGTAGPKELVWPSDMGSRVLRL